MAYDSAFFDWMHCYLPGWEIPKYRPDFFMDAYGFITDYLMHLQDLNGIGITNQLSLAAFIALCSAALNKPAVSSLAILGNLSISGTIIKVEELANVLQVCLDSGAKKVLLPITSAADMASVPPELMGKFNLIFYQSPEDAVFKALGVE